jgi:hypothetical protein
MVLLGKANWYLPSWLEWLPDLREREGASEAAAEEAGRGKKEEGRLAGAGGAEAS